MKRRPRITHGSSVAPLSLLSGSSLLSGASSLSPLSLLSLLSGVWLLSLLSLLSGAVSLIWSSLGSSLSYLSYLAQSLLSLLSGAVFCCSLDSKSPGAWACRRAQSEWASLALPLSLSSLSLCLISPSFSSLIPLSLFVCRSFSRSRETRGERARLSLSLARSLDSRDAARVIVSTGSRSTGQVLSSAARPTASASLFPLSPTFSLARKRTQCVEKNPGPRTRRRAQSVSVSFSLARALSFSLS